jgi:hypothetical protein
VRARVPARARDRLVARALVLSFNPVPLDMSPDRFRAAVVRRG